MSSHLRLQTSFEPFAAETSRSSYLPSPPPKKQKMSLTQTYYIAASARSKLGREACRPDHNLRLLVGHANLLDSLMLELADAEREQEAWFNHTVSRVSKAEEPKHIQWADSIPEEEMADDSSDISDDSDSDSDCNEDDYEMIPTLRRIRSPPVQISTTEVYDEDDEEFYEDFEDDEEHALTRIASNSPPELVQDEDESDDDSMPASPPQASLEYTEAERQAIATTNYYDQQKSAPLSGSEQSSFLEDGFFIPQRNSPLIASC